MEVNRDEAERCIDIATAALSCCQTEKARRFLEKAQRLFPTAKAKGEMMRAEQGCLDPRKALGSILSDTITCIPDEQQRPVVAHELAGHCVPNQVSYAAEFTCLALLKTEMIIKVW